MFERHKTFSQQVEEYVKHRHSDIRRFAFNYTLGLRENAAGLAHERFRLSLGECQHLKARKIQEARVCLNVLTFVLQVQPSLCSFRL